MSRNRITQRQLKPWMESAIADEAPEISLRKRARSVKIINHVAGVANGKCTKHVTDGQVYIAAHFTEDAVKRFLLEIEETDQATNWASALVILHDYSVQYMYVPSRNQNESEFVLRVDSFKLWDLQEGFSRKNQLLHIMDVPSVRKLATQLWQQNHERLPQEVSQSEEVSQATVRDESCNPGGGESESIGLTQLLEEMGRASPGVGQVDTENRTECGEKKENVACVSDSLLEKLFAPLSVDEFMITEELELEQIKEWRAEYRPSGSLGTSDSVESPAQVHIMDVRILAGDHLLTNVTGNNQVADQLVKATNDAAGESRPESAPVMILGIPCRAPDAGLGVSVEGTKGHSGYLSLVSQDISLSQVDSCMWQAEIDSVRLGCSDSPLDLSSPTATSTQIDAQSSPTLATKPALKTSSEVVKESCSDRRQIEESPPVYRHCSHLDKPSEKDHSSVQRQSRCHSTPVDKQSSAAAPIIDSLQNSIIHHYSSGNVSKITNSNPSISDASSGKLSKETEYQFVALCMNNKNYTSSTTTDQNQINCDSSECLTLGNSDEFTEMQTKKNDKLHLSDQGIISNTSSNSDLSSSQSLLKPSSHVIPNVMRPDTVIKAAERRPIEQALLNLSKYSMSDRVDQEFTCIKDNSGHQEENPSLESISNSTLFAHCRLHNPSDIISPSPPDQNPRYTQQRPMLSVSLKGGTVDRSQSSGGHLLTPVSLHLVSSPDQKPAEEILASAPLSECSPATNNTCSTNESATRLYIEAVNDEFSSIVKSQSNNSIKQDVIQTHDRNNLTELHIQVRNPTDAIDADVNIQMQPNTYSINVRDSERVKCEDVFDTGPSSAQLHLTDTNMSDTGNSTTSLETEKSVLYQYYSSDMPSPRRSRRLIKERLLKAVNKSHEERHIKANCHKSTSLSVDNRYLRPRHDSHSLKRTVTENVARELGPVELSIDFPVDNCNITVANELPSKDDRIRTEDQNIESNIKADIVSKRSKNKNNRVPPFRLVKKTPQFSNRITLQIDIDTETEKEQLNSTDSQNCARKTNDNSEFIIVSEEITKLPESLSSIGESANVGNESQMETTTENSFWRNNQLKINENRIKQINKMNAKIRKRIREEKQKRLATISDNTHLLNFQDEFILFSMECDDTPDIEASGVGLDRNHLMSNQATQTEASIEQCVSTNDNQGANSDGNLKLINTCDGTHGGFTSGSLNMLRIDSEMVEKVKNGKITQIVNDVCNLSTASDKDSVTNMQDMDVHACPSIRSGYDADVTLTVQSDNELDNGSQDMTSKTKNCAVSPGIKNKPDGCESFEEYRHSTSTEIDKISVEPESSTLPFEIHNFPETQEFVPTHSDILQTPPSQTLHVGSPPIGTQPFEPILSQTPRLSLDSDLSLNVWNNSRVETNISMKIGSQLRENNINLSKAINVASVNDKLISNCNGESLSGSIRRENKTDTNESGHHDDFSKTMSTLSQNIDAAIEKQKEIENMFEEIENEIESQTVQSSLHDASIASERWDNISGQSFQNSEQKTDKNLSFPTEVSLSDSTLHERINTVNRQSKADSCNNILKSKANLPNCSRNKVVTEKTQSLKTNTKMNVKNKIDSSRLISYIDSVLRSHYKEKQCSNGGFRVKPTNSQQPSWKKYDERMKHQKRTFSVKPISHSKRKVANHFIQKNQTVDRLKHGSVGILKQTETTGKPSLYPELRVKKAMKTYEAESLIIDGYCVGSKGNWMNVIHSPFDRKDKTNGPTSHNNTEEKTCIAEHKHTTQLDSCSNVDDTAASTRVVGQDGLVQKIVDGIPRFVRKKKNISVEIQYSPEQSLGTTHDNETGKSGDGLVSVKLISGESELKGVSERKHSSHKGKSKREHFAGKCKSEREQNCNESHPSKRRKTDKVSVKDSNVLVENQKQSISNSFKKKPAIRNVYTNDFAICDMSFEPGMKVARVAEWVHTHSPMAVTRTQSPGHKTSHGGSGQPTPQSPLKPDRVIDSELPSTTTQEVTDTTLPQTNTQKVTDTTLPQTNTQKVTDTTLPPTTTQEQWDKYFSSLKTPSTQLLMMTLPDTLNKRVVSILQKSSKK